MHDQRRSWLNLCLSMVDPERIFTALALTHATLEGIVSSRAQGPTRPSQGFVATASKKV
jgi:hypothetical protein